MNKKAILLTLPLLIGFLIKPNENENHLGKFDTIPLCKSIYNHDQYNDYVDVFNKYYECAKTYLNYDYFKTLILEVDSIITYNKTSLYIYENQYIFKILDYYLKITYCNDFLEINLSFEKNIYLYICDEFIDFRIDNIIYFIKDKYRIRLVNNNFSSILGYEEKIIFDNNLYKITIDNKELLKDNELLIKIKTISNIYLTEYFKCDIIN